jgi:hypothetical protein
MKAKFLLLQPDTKKQYKFQKANKPQRRQADGIREPSSWLLGLWWQLSLI